MSPIIAYLLALAAFGVLVALWTYREKIGIIWAFAGSAVTGLLSGITLLLIADRKHLSGNAFPMVVEAGQKQLETQNERLARKLRKHYEKQGELPDLPLDPETGHEDPTTADDDPDPVHVDVLDAFKRAGGMQDGPRE